MSLVRVVECILYLYIYICMTAKMPSFPCDQALDETLIMIY